MYKKKLKMDWRLKCKAEIRKLEKTLGRILFDISHSNMFFDLSPKAEEMKAKINKWSLITLTNICIAKEINNTVKRQPTEWEKICGNDMTNKRLMSTIYINK